MLQNASEQLERIHREAERFATMTHVGFIRQAMIAIRRAERENLPDPGVEALGVLVSLWQVNKRENLRTALNDIGIWLERRLIPGASTQLDQELGWLKREATYWSKEAGKFAERESEEWGVRKQKEIVPRHFGNNLERLRLERSKKRLKQARRTESEQPKRPATLPDSFDAQFVDFNSARDAAKQHKARIAKGRAPRAKRLPLRVAPELEQLVEGLYVETTKTQGFIEYFERVVEAGGKSIGLTVQSIQKEDSEMLATKIASSRSL